MWGPDQATIAQTGDLVVNLDSKTVAIGARPVHLTSKEYQMLELLSLRKGTPITKEMFLNHHYGGMDEPTHKIIDVFICKLRKKLGKIISKLVGVTDTHYVSRPEMTPGLCVRAGRLSRRC